MNLKKFLNKILSKIATQYFDNNQLNKELEALEKLFLDKDYEEVIRKGKKLLKTYNSSFEIERYIGLAFFRLEKYEEAEKTFFNLKNKEQLSEIIFFQSMSILKQGKIKKGYTLYLKAIKTFQWIENNMSHSIPYMQISCAEELIKNGGFQLAFKELNSLGETFCKYRILDETFLHMRAIPSFITYLDLLKKIEYEVPNKQYKELINELQERLGEDGNYFIQEIILKK
jgi:tetratricopeptide (TPR) repeat protein